MRALLVTLAGALAVASCGKVDTVGGHYPGAKLYQPAGGGYHLHYPDPPWTLADPTVDFGALTPELVARGVYLGHDLSPYFYELQVDRVGCSFPAQVATDEKNASVAAGEVVDFGVRDFENSAGDVASDYGAHDGPNGSLMALLSAKAQKTLKEHGYTVRARRTYFAATDAGGGCLRVLVLTVFDVEEDELTRLLGSFEPRLQGTADAGAGADGGVG
jgi:hypothetical protein